MGYGGRVECPEGFLVKYAKEKCVKGKCTSKPGKV